MEFLLAGLVAGLSLVSYAIVVARRSRRLEARAERRLAAAERTLETLRVGDAVIRAGRDFLVEGALTLDDDGRISRIYRLAGGEAPLWLALHAGEAMWLDAPSQLDGLGFEVSAPEELRLGGAPYRLAARVPVRVRWAGPLPGGGPPEERASLYAYAGAGARRLLALGFPERVEAFAGELVAEAALDLLPSR
jgi:hypothetical protein